MVELQVNLLDILWVSCIERFYGASTPWSYHTPLTIYITALGVHASTSCRRIFPDTLLIA
jgi:hypothetical protein